MKPNTVTAKDIEEATSLLPKEFEPINEEFKEKYAVSLDTLREFLADKGKLQLLEVDERQILCRIPNQQIFNDIRKKAESLSAFEGDSLLVSRCIYYPSMSVVNNWVSEGRPGLMTAFAARIMELGLVNIKATSKEF